MIIEWTYAKAQLQRYINGFLSLVFSSRVQIPTAENRLIIVDAEDRFIEVVVENRFVVVAAEDRLIIVI